MSKRLFGCGLIVTVLFACGHFCGFLQAAREAGHNPQMAELTRAMREQKASLLGFHPSILDFREYFSLNFSILLLLAAALGIGAMSAAPGAGGAIRRLSLIYAAAMLALLGTSIWFSVVQGMVTCLATAILFGAAWWLEAFPRAGWR